jgi:hypothetical protein
MPGVSSAQEADDLPPKYVIWRNWHFNENQLEDPSLSAPDADPDEDGLSNLNEWTLGGDPWRAGDFSIKSQLNENNAVLRYYHPPESALKSIYPIGKIIRLDGEIDEGFELRFQAMPDERYAVYATHELSSAIAWEKIADLTPEDVIGLYRVESPLVAPYRFFRIVRVDDDPPAMLRLHPPDQAVSVSRDVELSVFLSEVSGLDPDSIKFTLPGGNTVAFPDDRIRLNGGAVIFTPSEGQVHGDFGALVQAQLSVSDIQGNHMEPIQWEFELEKEPILASKTLVLNETPAAPFQPQLEQDTALKRIETSESELVYQYGEDGHPFEVGQVLSDGIAPDSIIRKVINLMDDPSEKVVTLRTENAALTDVYDQLSFNTDQIVALHEPGGHQPRLFEEIDKKGLRISRTVELAGETIFEHDDIRIGLGDSSWNVSADVDLYGKIEEGVLKTLQIGVSGDLAIELLALVTFEKGLSWDETVPLGPKLSYYYWIPGTLAYVKVDVELLFNTSIQSSTAGEARTGISINKPFEFFMGYNPADGFEGSAEEYPAEIEPVPFEWELEGGLVMRASFEPRITTSMYGLLGFQVQSELHVQQKGTFKLNPLKYEYCTSAGLKGNVNLFAAVWPNPTFAIRE